MSWKTMKIILKKENYESMMELLVDADIRELETLDVSDIVSVSGELNRADKKL